MANEQAQFEKALQQVQKDIIKLVDDTMTKSMGLVDGLLVGDLVRQNNFLAGLVVGVVTKGVNAVSPGSSKYGTEEAKESLSIKITKEGIQYTGLNYSSSYILTIMDKKNPKKLALSFYGGNEKDAETGDDIVYHPNMGITPFEIPATIARKFQEELAISMKTMAKNKISEIKVGDK